MGLYHAGKAMIRFAIGKKAHGVWEERQLFPHLLQILSEYRKNFNGTTASDSMCPYVDGAVPEIETESECEQLETYHERNVILFLFH